jgi:phosphoenolpyruvate carboxykinase (GTP)
MPRFEDIDWRGIENSNRETFDKTMSIDRELWKKELLSHEEFFERIYDKLPKNFSL